jgi:hypothetical protein
MKTKMNQSFSRSEFLRSCAQGAGALAILSSLPNKAFAKASSEEKIRQRNASDNSACDLRDFVKWVLEEFEPSVKLQGGAGRYARAQGQTIPELYGVADMACILYTLGTLNPSQKERLEWEESFHLFQNPDTGWFIEKDPTHPPLHNTAFMLSAMKLLEITPRVPLKLGAAYSDPRKFLSTLNWRTRVYGDSLLGAGLGAICLLVPGLVSTQWFEEYFAACDGYFDPNNGLMGIEKPALGDTDQVGGTFHFSFVYEHANRPMPYPERRIDSIIRLQLPEGYWLATNQTWLSLDALYELTRTQRRCGYRFEDVKACVRRSLEMLKQNVYNAEAWKKLYSVGKLPVHQLTAAVSFAAFAQQFLGSNEVITDKPLKFVLDRRPFI